MDVRWELETESIITSKNIRDTCVIYCRDLFISCRLGIKASNSEAGTGIKRLLIVAPLSLLSIPIM